MNDNLSTQSNIPIEYKILHGYIESRTHRINGAMADHPASETYDSYTPDEIKAYCDLDIDMRCRWKPWGMQSPQLRRFYRLKAYWILRGAKDPGDAAARHVTEPLNDPAFDALAEAHGWVYPTNLKKAEEAYLPKAVPSSMLIVNRCPQIGMVYALRGDVSEPIWWAALSITEHSEPNISRECSDGYPSFDERELAYRIDRVHKNGIKPALCSRLDSINPMVCDSCKYKGSINSPMALGYEREPRLKEGI